MKIGNVEFKHFVFMGPGLRGFFGEGYWFHFLVRLLFGDIWRGMNFAGKTTTFYERPGNLKMKEGGYHMKSLFPNCIIILWLRAVILNAVGLSGPGLPALLGMGRWQKRGDSWVFSFMAVGKTKEDRIGEYKALVRLLKVHLPQLLQSGAKIVIQLNFGCPNTEHPLESLRSEIIECLQIVHELGLPVMLNFNALVPAQLLLDLENAKASDGERLVDCYWIANSLPYDHDNLGERLFGTEKSPLRGRKGANGEIKVDGGISAKECLAYTLFAVKAAREIGVTLPIVAGNGVQSVGAVKALLPYVNGIEITGLAILRPWRVRRVAGFANKAFAKKQTECIAA